MGMVDANANDDLSCISSKVAKYDGDSSGSPSRAGDINIRKYAMVCALLASLNSVLLGYDVGVMSGAIIFIQENLQISEVQQEVLVGCLSIIAPLGGLAGGRLSDALGRKWVMGIGAIIFQIGVIIMTFSPSYSLLIIGRLLSGIGIGSGASAVVVYISEIAPASMRGFINCFPEIFINAGILLGYLSNYAFSGLPNNMNWRIMLGVIALLPTVICFALLYMPESPRWLVLQSRVEEARIVLMKTTEDEKELEERLDEIQQAANDANSTYKEKAVWQELLRPNRSVFKMLCVGVGIHFFQQATGSNALVYYSPTIFKKAGIEDSSHLLAATVALGVTKMSFTLVATFLIDKTGRKPLLYASTIGITSCLFCLASSLAFIGNGTLGISVAILAVCLYVAFFSIGIGPLCSVVSTEVFPLRLRAQAFGVAFTANSLFSGLVSLSFLSMCSAISAPGVFYVFSLVSAVSVVFVHRVIPETKGKTLEEIELLFKKEEEWNEGYAKLAEA